MNIKEIKDLVNLLNKSELSGLEWRSGEDKLVLKKEKETVLAAAPVAAIAPVASTVSAPTAPTGVEEKAATLDLYEVKSPMVGTFYSSPSPEAATYVKVGDSVSPRDVICIVEAMKLMNEIECDVAGSIVEVCVEDAQPVEFDTVLFRIKKS